MLHMPELQYATSNCRISWVNDFWHEFLLISKCDWRFAGLGAGLAWGTLQESAKRIVFGTPNSENNQHSLSPFLSERNAERLALALCRMRGAALKLGQMLSIQDESLVPAPVRKWIFFWIFIYFEISRRHRRKITLSNDCQLTHAMLFIWRSLYVLSNRN